MREEQLSENRQWLCLFPQSLYLSVRRWSEDIHHLDLESIQAFNNNLIQFKGNILFASHDFIEMYNKTAAHLKEINDYANLRYNDIQTDIFKNGSDDYFTVLKRLRFVITQMRQSVEEKYKARPLSNSQWDSKFIIGLFVIIFSHFNWFT